MKQTANSETMLIREIKLNNFLSFGPDTPALKMEALNVLIGPNGSGKSNLIEALALMRATPIPTQTTSDKDVQGVVRLGGGTAEWIWKGDQGRPASVELVVNSPGGKQPLRHVFAFRANQQRFHLHEERLESEVGARKQSGAHFYYRFEDGHPVIKREGERRRSLAPGSVNLELSILAQRRDPELYPEITYLAESYEKWRIYRDWEFGRDFVFRDPQRTDMRSDRLEEDFLNLGLFLNRLRKTPKIKRAIVEALTDLYEGLTDFETIIGDSTVQVFVSERDFSIPATRLSDGTLRYLCLLAVLCDPEPPPLICIEEPELGLHPDILPKLADLLVAASERTQLIVTTHSDVLVDAMTERPETVVICEKHEGRTEMRRLKKEDLTVWLEKYRLGQLWTRGEIGGTRW
jgi:predicted ATPase